MSILLSSAILLNPPLIGPYRQGPAGTGYNSVIFWVPIWYGKRQLGQLLL